MFPQKNLPPAGGVAVTFGEAIGAAAAGFLAFGVISAYLADRIGLPIAPFPLLAVSLIGTGGLAWVLHSDVRGTAAETLGLGAVVAVVGGMVVRLSPAALLPPGGGADLTHHLQLIDYLDRNWRLVHEPQVEAFLGEMVHYTPGAHLLAAMGGRWFGSDGFHAVFPLVVLTVALKAGFVYLIALRLLRGRATSMPFAFLAVALLFLPYSFFIGSFAYYSYVAQVVSELFAVVMWWAVVAWDDRPSTAAAVVFALAGAAAFLTWPVWVGPPLLAIAAVLLLRPDLPAASRLRTLAIAAVPIVAVAVLHAIGRLAWTRIVRTDADMRLPTLGDFNVWFVAASAAGIAALLTNRRGRATALLVGFCALQALTLFVAARNAGAKVPYMAIKMAYLTIYPLAAGAALAAAVVWQAVSRPLRSPAPAWIAWILAAVATVAIGRSAAPRRPQAPTVTADLYAAGQWARANLEPACVDYIVPQTNTAYWLHLAVLGNRRMSPRTADDATFSARDAIVRWINPGGLPYAIADLGTVPRHVLDATDQLARFGSAVVIGRRRGSGVRTRN